MAREKFYKYVYQVVVLSEEPRHFDNLSEIDYQIKDGDCVGEVSLKEAKELTGPEMAEALSDVGSEPEFFQLDMDGNPLEEDYI